VQAGVPFELVPGVSSIAAVPEAAGIPVTHRGVSQSVTAFVANDVEKLDARALAQMPGTLVAFMGGAVVTRLAERLIAEGKPASTPAAVVSCGTTERQQVVTAPLGAIGAAALDAPTPALVVIGEVVAVREALGARRRTAA
jgi:siroheme synthase